MARWAMTDNRRRYTAIAGEIISKPPVWIRGTCLFSQQVVVADVVGVLDDHCLGLGGAKQPPKLVTNRC